MCIKLNEAEGKSVFPRSQYLPKYGVPGTLHFVEVAVSLWKPGALGRTCFFFGMKPYVFCASAISRVSSAWGPMSELTIEMIQSSPTRPT